MNVQQKKTLWKNKKGINDISILAGLLFILLGTAALIPFVNSAFGTEGSVFDDEGLVDDARQDVENVDSFNAFTVLLTILKLAFWDFGDSLGLPWWLDLFFSVVTLLLVAVVGRNIWIGGGG